MINDHLDTLSDVSALSSFFTLMNNKNIEDCNICQKYISSIHISDTLTEIRGSIQNQLLNEQDYVFSFSELYLPCKTLLSFSY